MPSYIVWKAVHRDSHEGEDVGIETLQQDLGGGKKSRYDLRVHAMLLITSGLTADKVAAFFNVDLPLVLAWTRRLQDGGMDALLQEAADADPALEAA